MSAWCARDMHDGRRRDRRMYEIWPVHISNLLCPHPQLTLAPAATARLAEGQAAAAEGASTKTGPPHVTASAATPKSRGTSPCGSASGGGATGPAGSTRCARGGTTCERVNSEL